MLICVLLGGVGFWLPFSEFVWEFVVWRLVGFVGWVLWVLWCWLVFVVWLWFVDFLVLGFGLGVWVCG